MTSSILKRISLTILLSLTATFAAVAQQAQGFVHRQSDPSGYEWPTDTNVVNKLDRWRDLKFGVLFHWGMYSVPGIVESWSICSEDVDWITRKGNLQVSCPYIIPVREPTETIWTVPASHFTASDTG